MLLRQASVMLMSQTSKTDYTYTAGLNVQWVCPIYSSAVVGRVLSIYLSISIYLYKFSCGSLPSPVCLPVPLPVPHEAHELVAFAGSAVRWCSRIFTICGM